MFVTHSHKNNLNRMWDVQIIFVFLTVFVFVFGALTLVLALVWEKALLSMLLLLKSKRNSFAAVLFFF